MKTTLLARLFFATTQNLFLLSMEVLQAADVMCSRQFVHMDLNFLTAVGTGEGVLHASYPYNALPAVVVLTWQDLRVSIELQTNFTRHFSF